VLCMLVLRFPVRRLTSQPSSCHPVGRCSFSRPNAEPSHRIAIATMAPSKKTQQKGTTRRGQGCMRVHATTRACHRQRVGSRFDPVRSINDPMTMALISVPLAGLSSYRVVGAPLDDGLDSFLQKVRRDDDATPLQALQHCVRSACRVASLVADHRWCARSPLFSH
jgi:hypothetical protein